VPNSKIPKRLVCSIGFNIWFFHNISPLEDASGALLDLNREPEDPAVETPQGDETPEGQEIETDNSAEVRQFLFKLSKYAEKPVVVGSDIVETFWNLFKQLKELQEEVVSLDDRQFRMEEGAQRDRRYNQVAKKLEFHENVRKCYSKLHGQCRRLYPDNIVFKLIFQNLLFVIREFLACYYCCYCCC
jgi:hypothetical protein